MTTFQRAAAVLAFFACSFPATTAHARQQRDTLRASPPLSAEQLHEQRRAWLERRRLGLIDADAPTFGSAVVGAPRTGLATGVATGAPVPFGGFAGDAFALLHCSTVVFGANAATSWWPGLDPFGGLAFQGRCVPASPFAAGWRTRGWGHPGGEGILPYPAYPPVGRFYDRFHPDDRGWSGTVDPRLLGGIQHYDWGYYGPWRSYPAPFGWRDGAYGWSFAPGWSRAPAECVEVGIVAANGIEHRLPVGLQALGLADARDLDLAIDAQLSRGQAVTLLGLDGRVLRIEPGTPIDDIRLGPCR